MTDAAEGTTIAARTLPLPRSISPEAQAVLRRLIGEDGVPVNSKYALPDPADTDAWLALKAATAAHYAAMAETIRASLRSELETVTIGDTTVHVATPAVGTVENAALIDLHGGAFVFGGGEACAIGARMQADQHGILCYGIDYRMPPEHPYPAALDDCLATYRHALARHIPSKIIIMGRSAGGNLAAAMLLRARDEGLPMPAALILLSPEADLTESGDSFEVNQMVDLVLPGSLIEANRLYAAQADLRHPYLSPLFGNLEGFPPTFLQTGTRDLFLSNTVRMHRALRSAGVAAQLHVFEAMPHGGFMGQAPEDRELLEEIRRFIRSNLDTTGG
jgi:acetyl esterase/lipase